MSQAFENKHISIGLFLDLSKAFDCINHNILIQKMEKYGIRGTALDWFKSYLFNRVQYVSFNGISSDYHYVNIGVPQGSVLGPLLFLLYVNDLQFVSKLLHIITFADDTNLFLSGNNVNNLCYIFNEELRSVNDWFLANKLKLNVDKTCCMLFKSKNKNIVENDVNIFINNSKIPVVHSTKFLGVIIDDKLIWKNHIDGICSKISKAIGVINRVKHILPLNILVQLYYTMIFPHLTYCNIIWGNCAISHLNRILILQKRAIRIITNSSPYSHTPPLFKKLKLLKICDIYKFQNARFMYLFRNNMLPSLFNLYFAQNKSIRIYQTRQSDNYNVPNFKYEFSRSTIKFSGPTLWNSLPEFIKTCSSLSTFLHKYKEFLINNT